MFRLTCRGLDLPAALTETRKPNTLQACKHNFQHINSVPISPALLCKGRKPLSPSFCSPDAPSSEILHQIERPPTKKPAAYLLSTLSRCLIKHDGRTAQNYRLSTSRSGRSFGVFPTSFPGWHRTAVPAIALRRTAIHHMQWTLQFGATGTVTN